ncbi:MAG: hemerythrin domain-containing protein [Actinomycetota bacterium]
MNALTLLKQDHGNVEALFKRYEATGPDAAVEKRRIVDLIIEQLSVHAAIEEQFFYPTVRECAAENAAKLTFEGLEEHHVSKATLAELEKLAPAHERFDAKVTVLFESVRHHVEEEEQALFPMVRESLSAKQLDELGATMEKAKATAPTRPHPMMPDTPPWNLIVGAPAAVVDRVITTARDVVGKALSR